MPSPVKSDASGRKYYRRTGGAYIMSPNGRLKHVGTGKGDYSLRNLKQDKQRRAIRKPGRSGRMRYPQAYD